MNQHNRQTLPQLTSPEEETVVIANLARLLEINGEFEDGSRLTRTADWVRSGDSAGLGDKAGLGDGKRRRSGEPPGKPSGDGPLVRRSSRIAGHNTTDRRSDRGGASKKKRKSILTRRPRRSRKGVRSRKGLRSRRSRRSRK